jgi:ArsR family transcriptional regulator, virulence genes transcriptional regulator
MYETALTKPQDMSEMAAKAADVAMLLGTMASPVRLLILCKLVEGERPVHELVTGSGITQGALSQHLAKLRNLKLVETRRDGQAIYYSIASKEVKMLLTSLHGIFCADIKVETKANRPPRVKSIKQRTER